MDTQERLVKTNFSVQLYGYIIPEEFNSMITTKRQLTPKKLLSIWMLKNSRRIT